MPDAPSRPEPSELLAGQFRAMRGALLAWFRRRVPDPSEAEDLMQESFLRVSQRVGDQSVIHLDGYLYKTAQSVLADRRRRRSVRQAEAHVALDPDGHEADDIDALRAMLAKERWARVSAALASLPERTRAIFILRRLEGLRYGEIAVRFNISVSAVEKHMARAAEHLMSHMEDAP